MKATYKVYVTVAATFYSVNIVLCSDESRQHEQYTSQETDDLKM